MTLPSPNLDDRNYAQLVADAKSRIVQFSQDWNDLSPHDPGIVLLECFAYITDTMIYRLNRLPEKAYIAFLNLLGVKLAPPGAAAVELTFKRRTPGTTVIEIPRGTRVTAARATAGGEAPTFSTADTVSINPDESEVKVLAHHCTLVEGEHVGDGMGTPGQLVTVSHPPIVAPTGADLDLVVGVQASPEERDERAPAIEHDGTVYSVWREVESFTNLGPEDRVYIADRTAGTITFAPGARLMKEGALEDVATPLAAVPPSGRQILVWYRSGGGPEGNVPAGVITSLKDQIQGVTVTNDAPAAGGRPAEDVANALVRGPQELHSLERAVTARDFQIVALKSSGAAARAKAFTQADIWRHSLPGTVELLLVPYVPLEERSSGTLTPAYLAEHETDTALAEVKTALESRRPVGTRLTVGWAHYKTVKVHARIVVHREEDLGAVKRRVLERLNGSINPLPTDYNRTGWRFGESLRASNVYDIVLSEGGVRYVDRVKLEVEEAPSTDVAAIAADRFQPSTWYSGSGSTLFRSLNDGEGWEVSARFPGAIDAVRPHPSLPGIVAVSARADDQSSQVMVTFDSGESWNQIAQTAYVEDMSWAPRADAPVLFLATSKGLYEITVQVRAVEAGRESTPVHVVVDPTNPDRGFYAVSCAVDATGGISVATAAQGAGGVFLSSDAGRADSFRRIGLLNEDIRTLGIQYDGPRAFLWAGVAAVGADDPGKGCYSWELRGREDPPEGWRPIQKRWRGGTCWGLAFQGATVFAATNSAGVMRLDARQADPEWQSPDVRCGLPLRDPGRFHPVLSVASEPSGQLLMASGPEGVARSSDGGTQYEICSTKEFSERVTLPVTWLFCSGEHEVEVIGERATRRD